MISTSLLDGIVNHWHIWFVSAVLVVAAVIDGWKLKVPNWLTFPMIMSGWVYSFASGGWAGLGWSLLATCFGLALLYGIYMVGGMGAGDVKLLAGIGAWVHAEHTWNIFATTAIVGGVMAVAMIAYSGRWKKHFQHHMSVLMSNSLNSDAYDMLKKKCVQSDCTILESIRYSSTTKNVKKK